ncbi:MAG: hypothetical protein ACTSO4_17145 [Promethearchaeota archaeon]
MWQEINHFYIHIRGKKVKYNKIAIGELALILNRFQSLYKYLGHLVNPKLEKDDLLLYFTNIIKGNSIIAEIQHKEWDLTLFNEFEKPDTIMMELFDLILKAPYHEGLERFNDLFPSPVSRYEILKKLRKIWSTKSRRISIGYGKDPSNITYKKLPEHYRKRIKSWLDKEKEELIKEIRGFITRIRYDYPSSFTLIDENGNIITSKLESNIMRDVKRYATNLVKVKGELIQEGKNYKFSRVISITPEEKIIIRNKVKDLKIYKPLKFDIKWHEDGILLKEKDLGISLYLRTLSELEDELKDYLEFLKSEYAEEDDDNLESNARAFKKQLFELFGLS